MKSEKHEPLSSQRRRKERKGKVKKANYQG